jgi:hypothetical protein
MVLTSISSHFSKTNEKPTGPTPPITSGTIVKIQGKTVVQDTSSSYSDNDGIGIGYC